MANNPVQILLNANAFIADSLTPGGGPNKDFFANKDQQFLAHQNDLVAQLGHARAQLASSGREIAYAKVSMRSNAWAKSHRPTSALFRQEWTPVGGVSDLGELLIEVTQEGLNAVRNQVRQAEPDTRMGQGPNGREVPKPSRARSEVGAIAGIRSYEASDRRNFTARESATWLADARTGGYLLIQLFMDARPLLEQREHDLPVVERRAREYKILTSRLAELDSQLGLREISDWWSERGFVALHMRGSVGRDDQDLHEGVLTILDDEPLVRRVWLPPIAVSSRGLASDGAAPSGAVPIHNPDRKYPIVGVIDTGAAPIDQLSGWVVGRSDVLDTALQNQNHGTFIAGLLIDDGSVNSHAELNEDSCTIYDLGMHATDPVQAADVFPNGFADFLQQLEFEMEPAVVAGTRIFNMSLAIEELVRDDSYSPFAARLDDIADKHDIVFVLPTGNLPESQFRDGWPLKADGVLPMLANYRHLGQDRMYQPAESIRAVSVGALDPQFGAGSPVRPSAYTRRGPGTGLGLKPELAHLGGSASADTGLWSFDSSGESVAGCGTSYAAPQIAKTLANLDFQIEGAVRRETVVALAVHGASIPASLDHPTLSNVARDFVGFGMPEPARDVLVTGDDAITLVFESSLASRKELDFLFQWPQALVGPGGKCRGEARLTLVYRPPLDMRFGSETVRVNLEAFLRQEKVDSRTGELSYEGFFKSKGAPPLERERVAHGQKWGAVKQWNRTTRGGVGNSSQWKLVVEPLAREGVQIPEDGVPFTAILTIRDPAGLAPVFNQMRQSLQTGTAVITDIKTAQRLRPRP